ncbi:MAG: ATP-binding protein [Cyanobacteria bacterium P01_F01_bin.150]
MHTLTTALMILAYWCIASMLLAVVFKESSFPLRRTAFLGGVSLLFCSWRFVFFLFPLALPHSLLNMLEIITTGMFIWLGFHLLFRLPKVVAIPSSKALAQTNQELEQEILERTQVEQSLRLAAQQYKQALEFESLLKRITDEVRDFLDEKQILQTAVRALGEGLEVRSCNAALYDLSSKTAIVHYEYTTSFAPVQGRVMSMDNAPWLYEQLLTGQYFQFCSLFPNPARGRVSMLVSPIIDDNGVLGDLWLVNDADYGFKELELRLMQQVTNQCAIALRQARLYQESQAQVKELKRLNQLKNDFLSTVSHELRTPVANVKLATRMLSVTLARRAEAFEAPEIFAQPDELIAVDQQVREKELYYLKMLQDECQREINLVNDLLDLQRLEEEQAVLTVETINLSEWLHKTVKPFENRATNRQQSLTLETVKPLDAISTEPVGLGRIITELLNNACKYTPPGERIMVRASTQDGMAIFSVTNSGVEIPARELPHIFDKFYRVPSADPWKQGGTGLGLALIKSLVHHLDGTINVTSKDNQTEFTVVLPLQPTELSRQASCIISS